jgi:6-phosphogluconolactonase
MRGLRRVATAVGIMAFTVTGIVATNADAQTVSRVVGHVYVNDNTAGVNTIAAFNRRANGSLTPMPGSPFSIGGVGTGASTGSQGALQVTADGRYLIAVDAGSNQISVVGIKRGGGLTPPIGGPVSSAGIEPVSVAVHGSLVYVANAGVGGSNYTGFVLSGEGRLRPLAGSTVSLPDGSQPGDVLFNPTGTNLAGTRVGTSLIDSFRVRHDGRLAAAPGSPFPAQGPGPFGSEFRPTDSSELYVSNAHGGPNVGTVSAFRVSKIGELSSIGSSPYPDRQTAPCWVEISYDGRYLFTVNTAVPSISRYSIDRHGRLVLIGSTPFNDPTGLSPFDARLAPKGGSLWVVDSGAKAVSAFAVHGGDLTELSSSPTPLPADAAPFGIVVT